MKLLVKSKNILQMEKSKTYKDLTI